MDGITAKDGHTFYSLLFHCERHDTMNTGTFINHCGAESVTLDELRSLPEPTPLSPTHFPIRHDKLVSTVKNQLIPAGYDIVREEYSLRQRDGHDDMFGIFEFASQDKTVSNVAAIRNSGSMHFLAQIGCGERVFVCDNMSFSAQIVVGRKHTRHIERDLPRLAGQAIAKLSAEFDTSAKRLEVYRECELSRAEVHDVMMRSMSMRSHGCPASQLKTWLDEYDHPRHDEFAGSSAWSVKNAFTEVAKRWNFAQVQSRTAVLTGILDQVVDLPAKIEAMTVDADSFVAA